MMRKWRERRGVARDKDSGTIQGSDDGPPEAVLLGLECSLLQWGAPWDFKMSVSGPPWLCMEDEFGGGEERGALGRGKKSMVGPGLRWGWELENQGRFQDHSGGEMDLEWFWFLNLRTPSSHLVMGGGQEGPEDLSLGPASGSTVRWLVLSNP